jgi:hypothetical protein
MFKNNNRVTLISPLQALLLLEVSCISSRLSYQSLGSVESSSTMVRPHQRLVVATQGVTSMDHNLADQHADS